MRNFVIINGVNSNTINGLGINELPPITKPEMRNIREEIDGRDGDIITELGYSAYDKTITIGLFGTGYDINDIVAFFNGEGTIVFSNEPDKYYNFKILNQIDYESLQKFRTASITFHCQPFKYPLSETPLEIEYDYIEDEGETLTLNNTGNALMKLDLKGNTTQTGTPTPTSPIPVSVVSGDNDVVVCGKNLLKITTFTDNTTSKTTNGITATINSDGTISMSGTASANTIFNLTKNDFTLSGAFYYLCNSPSANARAELQCKIDGTTLYLNDYGTGNKRTANNSFVFDSLYIVVSNGTNVNGVIFKPMVALGTIVEPYQPYQSQTYEVDLPVENLIQLTGTSTTSLGITRTFNADGSITISGTSTGLCVFEISTFNAISGTTYTLSGGLNSNLSIQARAGNIGGIGRMVSESGSSTYTASANETLVIVIRIPSGVNLTTPVIIYPQLEKGSKANHYTPYGTTPIELCKIGTYQDYFTKNSDGQWCKYNAIGKVVLDGSEGWFDWSNNRMVLATLNDYKKVDSSTTSLLLSNYYQAVSRANSQTNNSMCFYSSSDGSSGIIVCDGTNNTSALLKTWLSTHNTNVYYVLNTPYLSLIEDNNLIEQLDNIQNAVSYTGQTNISQVNNDKAFIISAKALEKGTNEVVVNNIGNVYSKPLIALEGSGNVDIYLDNTQILKANVEDKMNIDIAQLEAYNPDTMTLLNRQVIGNYNSMTLQPGNNTIRIDGSLDKATITNYTRWL